MKYALVLLALVFFVGCGGGSSSCIFSDPETPIYDLDGQVWTLTGTTPTNDCPDPVTTYSATGTFTQSGNTLTASGSGFTFTGEISDNQVKWGGTVTVGGETMTVSCTTLTATGVDIGDTMSYTGTSWSTDYGTGSCSGTADGTFTRDS